MGVDASRLATNGGQKSRRALSTEQGRVREAQRAFQEFHSSCFWSERPDYTITSGDIDWVITRLRTYGGHDGMRVADQLCC